jgi:hypothetical protein
MISYYELMQLLQQKDLNYSFNLHLLTYNKMVDNINDAIKLAFEKEQQEEECMRQPTQCINQMKEVKAFIRVEDFQTLKNAYNKGLLKRFGDEKQHSLSFVQKIDLAIRLLVPVDQNESEMAGGSMVTSPHFSSLPISFQN